MAATSTASDERRLRELSERLLEIRPTMACLFISGYTSTVFTNEETRDGSTHLLKKPFVVSMGNVAASGGYWISMNADTIYADPSTITGSI